MRVLVFTPSFPRFKGDFHGGFIKSLCDVLSEDVEIQVLAPRTRTMEPYPVDCPLAFPIQAIPRIPNAIAAVANGCFDMTVPSAVIDNPNTIFIALSDLFYNAVLPLILAVVVRLIMHLLSWRMSANIEHRWSRPIQICEPEDRRTDGACTGC